MQESYDAIVIGGGPAGATFAKFAAKGGMQVLVLDKRKEIGCPVKCGEGITAHWEKKIKPPLYGGAISYSINGARVFAPNGKNLKLVTSETKGYVLERKIFDKYVAIEAARAGASVHSKALATELVVEKGKPAGVKALLYGEVAEFRAPLVVSAEGMEALVARQAGFNTVAPLYDVDSCYQYEMVNVDCEKLIEIWFSNKFAKRGYVWVFPKAKDVANVGVGVGGSTSQNPKERLDAFLAAHPERFKNAQIVEVKAGNIWVGAPLKKLVSDGFMVIGTAAHQVDPIHGGGIALAIEAGEIAAEAALKAFAKGDYSQKFLGEYEKKWRAAEEGKLAKRLLLRKVLESFTDDDFNSVFDSINDADLDKILAGDYKPVVAKVLLKRPSLLKVLKAIA